MFALGQHAGSPYMRGTRCGIAHSAAELRNVPRAHLAAGEAQAVPIYPSLLCRLKVKLMCNNT